MTQPGETDMMSASDHIKAILNHGKHLKLIDYALVNSGRISPKMAEKYRKENAYPIEGDIDQIRSLGVKPFIASFVDEKDVIRHDPTTLAKAILDIVIKSKPSSIKYRIKKGSKGC